MTLPFRRAVVLTLALALTSCAGEADLRKLAEDVSKTPTTETTLKARADRLERVLEWAREGLPGAVKVEDTLGLRAQALFEQNRGAETCAAIDAAVLALRDAADGKLMLATPTGAEGVHPRLFLTAGELPGLREKAKTTHREILASLEKMLDGELRGYEPMTPGKAAGQVDLDPLRGHGSIPGIVAFSALITQDPKRIALAKKWLLAECAIERWGTAKGGEDDGHEHDLVAGHALAGVALAYDWLYDVLTPAERTRVRNKLANQAAVMYAAASVRMKKSRGWQDSLFQNHNWVNNAGLGLAGWALEGEFAEAPEWAAQAEANARRVLEAWAGVTDGSNHEGYQYWSYGTEALLMTLDQMKRRGSGDPFAGSAWLRAAAAWRLAGTMPRTGDHLGVGDCIRQEIHSAPAVLRKLAAEYRQGFAQELASEVAAHMNATRRGGQAPFEFLWYDAGLAPEPLEKQALSAYFPDQGLVTARSAWAPGATFFSFKCGAPGGRTQFDHARGEAPDVTYCDMGHDHADQNSFTFYARESYLLDDGLYEKPKSTANHNTVLVDGKGQLGEGRAWFSPPDMEFLTADRTGKILFFKDSTTHVETAGEASRCYDPALGLKRFTRRALYLRPDVVLLVDDLEADKPRKFDYVLRRYDAGFDIDGGWITSKAKGQKSGVGILVLEPARGAFASETFESDIGRGQGDLHGIKLSAKTPAAKGRFVTLVCPLGAGDAKPRAEMSASGSGISVTVTAAGKTWTCRIPAEADKGSEVEVK